MIVENAELSLKIAKAACEKKKKEELEFIENKFKDLLTDVAKRIHSAAREGKSSVKIIDDITNADLADIKWYLEMNHYDVWRFHDGIRDGYVISWEGKDKYKIDEQRDCDKG